ncbi:RDD family protein [Actinacidiphila bryophytorum]|uniref:RDD family protein n=1 Tax=Actinacidiphila bryophytorum TaxID=1436133 RepID=UPI002176D005|nr:RDD family protein [Actinacidiphila bryophytorum]UWE08838.1 RDD family protein [Actinacidiphila bryophytorum]
MDNREVIGSWLSGPRAAAEKMGADFGYRGERLGLPKDGPGSIASVGRRVAALFIDWILSALIAYGLIAHRDLAQANNWALVVFAAVSVIGLGLVGSTPGKMIMRLRVVQVDGSRLSPLGAALRTLLLVLVVPAVVFDRDTRGLHDRAVKAVQVRI